MKKDFICSISKLTFSDYSDINIQWVRVGEVWVGEGEDGGGQGFMPRAES